MGNSISNHSEKIQIYTTPSEFLLLWTLVRYTDERNPKFQVLGSSGTLIFQLFRIGPLNHKMTATMQKLGQFLREVLTQLP